MYFDVSKFKSIFHHTVPKNVPERLKLRKTNCHKFAFSKFQKFKPIFYLIIQYLKIVPECLKLRNSNCNQLTLRRFKNSNRYFNHTVTKHLEFTWKFEPELPNSNLHFDVSKIQTSILPSVLPNIVFNHQKLRSSSSISMPSPTTFLNRSLNFNFRSLWSICKN